MVTFYLSEEDGSGTECTRKRGIGTFIALNFTMSLNFWKFKLQLLIPQFSPIAYLTQTITSLPISLPSASTLPAYLPNLRCQSCLLKTWKCPQLCLRTPQWRLTAIDSFPLFRPESVSVAYNQKLWYVVPFLDSHYSHLPLIPHTFGVANNILPTLIYQMIMNLFANAAICQWAPWRKGLDLSLWMSPTLRVGSGIL